MARSFLTMSLLALAPASLALSGPVVAQVAGYGQTLGTSPQERQVYDGAGAKSSVLDATNPIDLMNRLRRSTAMDDATSPGQAVDKALKDFDTPAPAPAATRPGLAGP
jgi:hypothetical protein